MVICYHWKPKVLEQAMAKIEVLTQKNDFQILRLRQVHMLVASLVKLAYLHILCNEKI